MSYGSLQYTVIASGAKISAPAVLTRRVRGASMVVPIITSGQLIVQGSVNDTLYTRAKNPAASGDLQFATGPGSVCVALTDTALAFSSIKLESTVAVTVPTTITVWSKP